MAINFPANPSNGDVHAGFTYNSTKSVWEANSPSMMATSDTAPTSPSDGQMWFDTDGGGTFVYYEDADSNQWVEVIGSQGSPGADGAAGADGGAGVASVYATVDNLPTSGNSQGDMAHVTANNTLYFWNGSGWYKIALINTNPSISGVSSSYSLATDGTATVVTVTASDPEGLPITYSIASDTSGNIATVTQGTGASSNVFTVTPSTNTADAGSFTLTFRASDGVNLATAPASFTLQFTVENSNYTTALITSEGANNAVNNSFVDSSTNSHTITAAGDVTQTTFSPYRSGGYSTYFDGSGDYLVTAADSSLTVGTGQFTLECWFRTEQDTQQTILALMTSSSNVLNIFYYHSYDSIGIVDSGFLTGDTGSGDNNDIIELNQWYHLALVRDATTMYLYIDGALKWSASNSTNYNNDNIWIGRNQYGNEFKGHITDVRLVKGTAITPSAGGPTERLTAVTNTSLLTCHLPYIADGSTNSHTITVNGNTKTEPFAPYDHQEYSSSSHGGSMYFDGTGDYLSAGTSSYNETLSGDFCIEAWIYPTGANDGTIIGNYLSGPNRGWSMRSYTSNNLYLYYQIDGGAQIVYQTPSNSVNPNAWNHVVWCRSGTDTSVFINGSRSDNRTLSGTSTGAGGVAISSLSQGFVGYHFTGHMTNPRIVNGSAVYDPSQTTLTVPTAPLTAITNTSLLLSGTNAGIIDKSQTSSVLVLDGDTKCSSTQTKYRSTAIYTDGTGDRVRFGINNKKLVCDWGVGGEPFTVEWWMYDTQPYTAQHSFGPQTGGGAGAWNSSTGHQWITYWNSNVLNIYYYGTNGSYNGNTCTAAQLGIVQNQWQHIAHTYDGTTWRLYVDGVHGFDWVLPNQPASVSGTFAAIGAFAEAAYYTAAYYDDVRITKGLARYTGTSSFTPPAAALKG